MDFFNRNLTELARAGALRSFYGRDKVLQQAVAVLGQDGKANVVFTGEPGVGKTAVVEALAQRIAAGNVPENLQEATVYELDMNALVAGTIYHGQFEQNAKTFVDFLMADPSAIVFIDEIHSILSVSSDKDRLSPLANFLKPYLARGEIRMIGATTNKEYESMNAKDSAFTRRFVRIDVPEPTREEAISIIVQTASKRARESGLVLADGVAEAAVDLSMRYVQDRRLPDKAIDLLAGCLARKSADITTNRGDNAKLTASTMLEVIERELQALEKEDWSAASEMAACWTQQRSNARATLTLSDLQSFATERYGGLDSGDASAVQKVLGLEAELRGALIGQDRAIQAVCSALKRMIIFGRSVRPIGSFLFLGPTGVGKTELCRLLALRLWGQGALLQYNMSEYMDRVEATKLIGAAPGYIGFEEGGRLVRDVAARPSSVVLFDEIEKAHPDIHNLLLQILEEGKLQDGMGKTCNFSQSVVILTSNIAAEYISSLSTEDLTTHLQDTQRTLLNELKRVFRPEIVNRIDEIVTFAPLEREHLERILDLLLADENRRLKENNRPRIQLTNAARKLVLDRGYDPSMGARPLRRALQKTVEDSLSDYLLKHSFLENVGTDSELVADVKNGEMFIRPEGGVQP